MVFHKLFGSVVESRKRKSVELIPLVDCIPSRAAFETMLGYAPPIGMAAIEVAFANVHNLAIHWTADKLHDSRKSPRQSENMKPAFIVELLPCFAKFRGLGVSCAHSLIPFDWVIDIPVTRQKVVSDPLAVRLGPSKSMGG